MFRRIRDSLGERKRQRQDIQDVICRWLGPFAGSNNFHKNMIAGSGVTIGALAIMDFLVTGGLGTMTFTALTVSASSTATVITLDGSFNFIDKKIKRENRAGQTMNGSPAAQLALSAMEDKLRAAFSKAARADSSRSDRRAFLTLAGTVAADAGTLAPVFNILSGGPRNLGTAEYVFMLEDPETGGAVTLGQALAQVRLPPRKSTPPAPPPPDWPHPGFKPE